MYYHASKKQGLKVLQPHISTHEKAYVYAIQNRVTAICFGAPKDDFDLLTDEVDGKPVLYECYPDALSKVYGGKSCSLYTVSEDGFLHNRTGWDSELVSETPVDVVGEELIPDIYDYLMRAARRGECELVRYSPDEKYVKMLREELTERIAAFGISEEQICEDERFRLYLSELLK